MGHVFPKSPVAGAQLLQAVSLYQKSSLVVHFENDSSTLIYSAVSLAAQLSLSLAHHLSICLLRQRYQGTRPSQRPVHSRVQARLRTSEFLTTCNKRAPESRRLVFPSPAQVGSGLLAGSGARTLRPREARRPAALPPHPRPGTAGGPCRLPIPDAGGRGALLCRETEFRGGSRLSAHRPPQAGKSLRTAGGETGTKNEGSGTGW